MAMGIAAVILLPDIYSFGDLTKHSKTIHVFCLTIVMLEGF